MKITFDVDPRTASALMKYAASWSMTPGEIIDGLMRNAGQSSLARLLTV